MFTMCWPETVQERRNRHKRRDLAQLCRLAFEHQGPVPSNLETVFDQKIELFCCRRSMFGIKCCIGYDPLFDEAPGYHPLIVFKNSHFANTSLYKCIEWGQCPCFSQLKERLVFLPACAAAAAGNLELCWSLLRNFFRQYNHQAERPQTTTERLDCIHSLVEQVVHHLIYFGHGKDALWILEDLQGIVKLSISNNSKLSFMNTALSRGHYDTFWLLVDRFGKNIRATNGQTPLFLAMNSGIVSIARELLRLGADRDIYNRFNGMRSDIVQEAIVRPYSDEMIIMMLEEGLGQGDPQDPWIPSSLQLAIGHGRYTVVDYLVQKGQVTVPMIALLHGKQQTLWVPAVAWCCVYVNELSMARHLVQKGLDCVSPIPSLTGVSSNTGVTPLHAVVWNQKYVADKKLIDLFIEHGADVNGRTPSGDTPLALAMRTQNIDIVKKLLHAGAILDSPMLTGDETDFSEYRKEGKCSFLRFALQYSQYNMAEMALVAGYRVRRERWFVKGDFPVHTPPNVIEKLKRLSLQPLSLKCLCRRALKESVGGSLLTFLRQADLGPGYEDDILLKDLVSMYKIK